MSKRRHEASSFGPLLGDSKITTAERRAIRCREREILQELRERSAEASQLTSTIFQSKAKELDAIYTQVVYPREANLDACNLDEFSNLVVKQAGLMSASDLTKFDTGQFINSAKAKCCCEDTESDTQLVAKERRAPRRRRAENLDEEEVRPTQVTKNSLVQEDVQANRMNVLIETIQEVGTSGLFDLCLNPKSFAQVKKDTYAIASSGSRMVVDDRKLV
ncbi:hypothetical protein DYB36_003366 [Aphanomyces astaci]|uniref:Non-structural maintenance of chromosomes element 4 n=1 Tax=Aphanomyces astaci TaxID=112090 RepID=A0A397AGA0_APHAT|nr:hypothetical protein DYB36_003366 [Aphanomyces astaci]